MDFRPYQPADYDGCRAAILSHPAADGALAEAHRAFLDTNAATYFVLEHDGSIAGCGGYRLDPPDSAALEWIAVRADLLRNGLGRFLVFGILRKLTQAATSVRTVTVSCSANVAPFFEKQGFHRAEARGEEVCLVKKMEVCGPGPAGGSPRA